MWQTGQQACDIHLVADGQNKYTQKYEVIYTHEVYQINEDRENHNLEWL